MQELYLITGFLGAGKTTFLNNTAKLFSERRIAVIVNEFGKQGVDGSLISANGIKVTEITNGSVFCVCRMDMFIDALVRASESHADVLLVETSGLSNPTNIDDILVQTKTASGVSFDYKGCICLVDALNFEKVFCTAIVTPDQIKQSSLVLINKTDLARVETVEKIEGIIKNLNPECQILHTVFAEISGNMFAELMPKKDRVRGGKQDLLSGSLAFSVLKKPGADAFRKLIDGIKPLVYRCKGYVSLAEGDFFVDGVMEDVSILETKDGHQPGIVLLYKTSNHVKKEIKRLAEENQIEIQLA